MYSYKRNQQPSLLGKTERVRKNTDHSFSELHYARKQVIEACKRAGGLFVHWRRFTPEFNNGRCTACYNYRTKTPEDPRCPNCFATGFEGGFSKGTIQYMIVEHSDRRLEATSTGFVRMHRAMSKSPYLPNIAVSDILGEIKNIEGRFEVDDRYLIEDGVDKKRFRLADNLTIPNTFDHLDPESEVFSYEFQCSRIPKAGNLENRDIKYSIPLEDPVWLASREIGG